MVGLAGGVAPVIGGAVVGMLERSTFEAFGWSFGVYQIVFAMNALMRVAAALSLGLVPGRGRATAGEVLAQIGSARIGTVVQMRRMQRAHSAEERLRATRALSGARATLAVDELIAALDDPSQMVREEAALALGEIGDERAVEPLIERLAEPETGIVDECARALGRLGDRRAVEPLLALLRDGDRLNRALAARALGRIGVREAAPDIASVLGVCDPATESEVMEACISALGALGNPAAVSVLGSLLVSEERSIRLASARAIGDIGDAASGPLLLDALRNEHEPAVLSHLAVALALVDHAGSIPDILGALNRTSSVVARRQILNAVGTLIGEHDRLYPLLGAEAFARDAAVEKLLHELAREGSVPHEQTDAILAAYLEAEHGRAAAILVASAQRSGGDRSGVLGWVARQDRAALGLDEFLLALVALRASRG
jgi:HEAT repeat protein